MAEVGLSMVAEILGWDWERIITFNEFPKKHWQRIRTTNPGGSPAASLRARSMCGNSTHLHEALKEEMKMTGFILFGHLVPPKVAAANLGGGTLLGGTST